MAEKNKLEINSTEEYLSELYHDLMTFYANSHVPENIDDIKGVWIIDKKEQDAIKIVLDVLKDCGADSNFYERK